MGIFIKYGKISNELETYEGDLLFKIKHGHGLSKFKNGGNYLGRYKLGKRCGYGVYVY